jgi:hypothetical protein
MKMCEDAAVIDNTVYCCILKKSLLHKDAPCVPEDNNYLLSSTGTCPNFLGLRTSIILPVHG